MSIVEAAVMALATVIGFGLIERWTGLIVNWDVATTMFVLMILYRRDKA